MAIKKPLSAKLELRDDKVFVTVSDDEGREVTDIEVDPDESKVRIGSLRFRAGVDDWYVESGTATLAAGKLRST